METFYNYIFELFDNKIIPYIILATIPGGIGGLTCFLYGYKKGLYRNNMYIRKICIELLGAMFVSTFISFVITNKYLPVVAFILGLFWTNVIQLLRVKITSFVEVLIGKIELE